MFPRYAVLVKNLKGVVLFDPNEKCALRSVQWLTRRFRYRTLGVTPALAKKFSSLLERKPFRALDYPTLALKELVELMASKGLSPEAAEALVLSSSYISPLILVGSTYFNELEPWAAGRVNACKELSVSDWKLHLRIADYSTLDMYETCVEEALTVLKDLSKKDEILLKRVERIKGDAKRYWRIACSGGRSFLLYFDILAIAAKLMLLEARGHPDWAAALGIVAAVYVPPCME